MRGAAQSAPRVGASLRWARAEDGRPHWAQEAAGAAPGGAAGAHLA